MDEKKIEYLKRHLDSALTEDNYIEANSCYQELLKLVSEPEISNLTKRINDYNAAHAEKHAKVTASSKEEIRQRLRSAKEKHAKDKKSEVIGLAGGVGVMLFGAFLVVCGSGSFGSYNDFVMYGGMGVAVAGFIMVIIGTLFAGKKSKSFVELGNRRNDVFNLIVEQEEKLKLLDNVETLENDYVGQVQNGQPHGFGVGIREEYIYVGEWKYGAIDGIGKLFSDDLLMTLEGEFINNQVSGVADIQWEDGSEWHGEYKNGLPLNGSGKTIVAGKVQEGVWKNGTKQ